MSNDFDLTDSTDDEDDPKYPGARETSIIVEADLEFNEPTEVAVSGVAVDEVVKAAERTPITAEEIKAELDGDGPDPDKGELVGFRTCAECGELFIGYRDTPCEDCQDE